MASLQDALGPAVLWLGVHHDDHTGYPDCRPEFVEAADQAVRLGTQYQLRVQAPFVDWSKADIIRWGLEHDVPYELTHSCYQGRSAGLRRMRHVSGAAGGFRRGRRHRSDPVREKADRRPRARSRRRERSARVVKTTITVSTTFAAAHRLPEHEGKCCRLHGHTYGLEVTVQGTPQPSGPAAGMVMDFADLRQRVNKLIVEPLDHQLLNDLFDFVPTVEAVGGLDLRASAGRRLCPWCGCAWRGAEHLRGSDRLTGKPPMP